MKAAHSFLSVCGAATLALMLAVPSQAQQAAQSTMPRGPIKTPLGRTSPEILLSKITVSDMPKSYDFYTKIIGLKIPVTIDGQPAGAPPAGTDPKAWPNELALNFSGSLADGVMDLLPPRKGMLAREMANLIVIGFKVPDAPAVIKRAKDAGYDVAREAPTVEPGVMSIGMLHDPDGYLVEIIQAADYPKDKR